MRVSDDGSFQIPVLDINWGTTYYYRSYAKQSDPYKITYGEVKEFMTDEVTASLVVSTYFDTAVFDFKFDGMSEIDKPYITLRLNCSNQAKGADLNYNSNDGVNPNEQLRYYNEKVDDNYRIVLHNRLFNYGSTYYYRYGYGREWSSELFSFVMGENVDIWASVDETSITASSATINGQITGWSSEFPVEVGIAYRPSYLSDSQNVRVKAVEISTDGKFTCKLEGLSNNSSYTYCPYHRYRKDYTDKGLYKFKTVKGNSNEYLKDVASCKILWESYGTSASIQPYDLIKGVCYRDEYIAFQTVDSFKEGNAVIAATDAAGNILWSWHIWMTDQPQGQVYYNDAGTMMERNLGATTTVPGSVGALGLLYQWGRKDPFLGSSSISDNVEAKSTINWPAKGSNSSIGTIEDAIAHPTTFIITNGYDWCTSVDNTRWTESSSAKSIYDPCPVGWRVPDGGGNGVWSKALGSSWSYSGTYDSTNEGMNFSGKFGADQIIWYPASGYQDYRDGSLVRVGNDGYYWSASPGSDDSYDLYFYYDGSVYPSTYSYRASGQSVRCIEE